jgi:hypothetical protein
MSTNRVGSQELHISFFVVTDNEQLSTVVYFIFSFAPNVHENNLLYARWQFIIVKQYRYR